MGSSGRRRTLTASSCNAGDGVSEQGARVTGDLAMLKLVAAGLEGEGYVDHVVAGAKSTPAVFPAAATIPLCVDSWR
jgi:hypothetical protein